MPTRAFCLLRHAAWSSMLALLPLAPGRPSLRGPLSAARLDSLAEPTGQAAPAKTLPLAVAPFADADPHESASGVSPAPQAVPGTRRRW